MRWLLLAAGLGLVAGVVGTWEYLTHQQGKQARVARQRWAAAESLLAVQEREIAGLRASAAAHDTAQAQHTTAGHVALDSAALAKAVADSLQKLLGKATPAEQLRLLNAQVGALQLAYGACDRGADSLDHALRDCSAGKADRDRALELRAGTIDSLIAAGRSLDRVARTVRGPARWQLAAWWDPAEARLTPDLVTLSRRLGPIWIGGGREFRDKEWRVGISIPH